MIDQSFNPADLGKIQGNKESLFATLTNSEYAKEPEAAIILSRIAIVCSSNELCEQLRLSLYKMPDHFDTIQIIDLGEIKNQDQESLIKIQTVFVEQGIVPVYLGFNKNIVDVITEAQLRLKLPHQIALLSSKLNLFEKLTSKQHPKQIYPVGFQTQFCKKTDLSKLLPEYFTQLRLGKIRTNIHLSEPFLRQAQSHIIDLDVMRHAELPDHNTTGPSGLFSEEICQLAKYIGIADHLQSIAILGLEKLTEANSINLVAQIIWYIFQGFATKIEADRPELSNQTIQYSVESNAFDKPLKFIKSTQSGKWWVQHMFDDEKYLACSYEDYLLCCQNEIPDRILSACFH